MLADSLKSLLGNTFGLYFKAHTFHWNIEGPDFAQYHEFLGDFYTDVFNSVDTIAELIRTLNVYAPTTLKRMVDLSDVIESDAIPTSLEMIRAIKVENDKYLAMLLAVYKEAEDAGEIGISNVLQDRITSHEKHAWMLRSITK